MSPNTRRVLLFVCSLAVAAAAVGPTPAASAAAPSGPRETTMVFSGTGQTPRRLCSPAYPGRATVTVADSTAAVFEMKVRQVVEGGSVSVGTITSEGGSVSLGSVTAGSCFDLILRHKGPGPARPRTGSR